MPSVWLYLIGAAIACVYAVGASMAWLPSSLPVALASSALAALFVLAAARVGRRPRPSVAQAAGGEEQGLLDALDDIVFQADADAALSFMNRAWTTVTALDIRDCVGKSLFDYVHPDDQALVREQFLTIAHAGRSAARLELRLLGRDARPCWVELRLAARRGRAGGVDGVSGIMTDIQSRKRAEDVLRARDRSLSTLLDHLPGMAFRCRNDREWTMEFVSEGCFELTGYEALELLDHPSYDQLIVADDRAYVRDYVQKQLAQQRACHLRYRIRTRDGGEKWVEERSRGVFASNAELLAIEGFISDVSEQQRDEARRSGGALHDELTGLKSRTLLLARIGAAVAGGSGAAIGAANQAAIGALPPTMLMCIDIDRFGRINARHGRAIGDQLLAAIGHRLARLRRPGVMVGRIGSDEFGVLVHGQAALPGGRLAPLADMVRFAAAHSEEACAAAGVAWAIAWVDVVAELLDAAFEFDDLALSISARVGLVLGIDTPGDAEAMLREATQAAWSAPWHRPRSAVRYGFAGARARRASQAWRHVAGEIGHAFDPARLAVSLAPVAGRSWVEGAARWHGARSGTLPRVHMFLHACVGATRDILVADSVRAVCAAGLPSLQADERLVVRLDALPPDAALLVAVHGALQALPGRDGAARVVVLLALPPANAAPPPLAELQALRDAGVQVAVDLTPALAHGELASSAWLLLADCWRIAIDRPEDPGAPWAGRLALLLDLAARRRIAVLTGARSGADVSAA